MLNPLKIARVTGATAIVAIAAFSLGAGIEQLRAQTAPPPAPAKTTAPTAAPQRASGSITAVSITGTTTSGAFLVANGNGTVSLTMPVAPPTEEAPVAGTKLAAQ